MRRFLGLLLLVGLGSTQPLRAPTSGSWDGAEQVEAWSPMALKLARGKWGVAVADQQGTDPVVSHLMCRSFPPLPSSSSPPVSPARWSAVMPGARPVSSALRSSRTPGSGRGAGGWGSKNGDVTLERLPGTGPMLRDLAAQLRIAGIRELRGPLELTSQTGAADAVYPAVWSNKHRGRSFAPLVGAADVPRERRAGRGEPRREGRVAGRFFQMPPRAGFPQKKRSVTVRAR